LLLLLHWRLQLLLQGSQRRLRRLLLRWRSLRGQLLLLLLLLLLRLLRLLL
jgi:hypothetical protein